MMLGQWPKSHGKFKQLAKVLIRLHICAGWSEPLLFAYATLLEISCCGSFNGSSDIIDWVSWRFYSSSLIGWFRNFQIIFDRWIRLFYSTFLIGGFNDFTAHVWLVDLMILQCIFDWGIQWFYSSSLIGWFSNFPGHLWLGDSMILQLIL